MLPEDPAPEAAEASTSPEGAQPSPIDQEPTSTPEPEQTVEAQPDSPPEPADSDSDERTKPRSQERIEQLSGDNRALRESAEYWREQALVKAQPAPEPPKEDPMPTMEAHDFDQDKWAQAYTSWADRRAKENAKDVVTTQMQAQTAAAEQNAILAGWQDRASQFTEQHPDFEAIAYAPTVQITPDMFAVMQESEKGPDLAYHLGKNPDKAARIARMRPQAQAAALGRLEAEIVAPKPQPSGAPEPPNPIGGGQTPAVDLSKETVEDFMIRRREETRANRSR